MEEILKQIEKGLDCNNYYLSLFISLALPDICGAIESENFQASKQKYISWFNKYIKNNGYFIDGMDCYYFRCSMLHQACTEHKNNSFSKIIFIEPNMNSNNILHNNILNDCYNIDVKIFCKDMINSVRTWLNDIKDKSEFQINYSKLIKRHEGGLAPYIVGLNVIG